MRTLLACGGVAAALALATPAHAHSYLQSSDPSGGSTAEKPPAEVTITFTEDLEPKFSQITVRDGGGRVVSSGPAHPVGNSTTVLAVPVKPLKPGSYTVVWHVTSTDTHKTHGSFTFDVTTPD